MVTVSVVILCAAVVMALILNLALKPAYQAKLTVCCLVFSGVAGLCFYGAGLWELTHDLPLTLLRTVFSVFRMFIGVNELSLIASSRLVSTRAGLLCFWLAHLLAYYCFASAAMNTLGAENICVVRCGDKGARYQERIGSPILTENIYRRAYLSAEDADRSAILLNAGYDVSGRSDWDKWVACDSFSKMSSRASADFAPTYIRASGCTREELIAGNWHPSEEMLRNLGETEHKRWNAFHFAMGYRPMSEEEFNANAERWRSLREQGTPGGFKISKNSEARTHACLVSWEELPALSERESAITGSRIDYRQLDINNVLSLPKLLRAEAGIRE